MCRDNVFEHYHEGFEAHTLPTLPAVIHSYKEYKERSNLDPTKGNLWGCFWDACGVKEKGFWEAALAHNETHSSIDDSKIYHPITFGEEYPGYRPKADEVPTDKPKDNDPRFCYHTTIKLWKNSLVSEERTHRIATDKARPWLDAVQNINPDIQVIFPSTQQETDQAIAAAKASKQGARKRQSSVPPESDTAKAKQARAQAEEGEKKAGKGKGRIPAIPKQELATAATALATRVSETHPNLRYKDRRTIQSLASEWYRSIYHTKYHMSKSDYLDHLCKTATVDQDVKERDSKFKTEMIKALTSLKALINDPTKAGLPDPHKAPPPLPIGQKRPASTAPAQLDSKVAKAKAGKGSYADAITGKATSLTLPIGAKAVSAQASAKADSAKAPARADSAKGAAKSASAKPPAKPTSGVIGAPVPPKGQPKVKSKDTKGISPIGAVSTAKQDAAKQNEPPLTADSALDYLRDSSPSQSFNEYQQAAQGASDGQTAQDDQTAQDGQTAQDDQTAQDEQIALACQADLDAQAAQDAAATGQPQAAGYPDLDEEDDANMQQALILSRQHDMSQGSDPQAASSAGTAPTTEQELQRELQLGLEYQTEVQTLQMKMQRGPLSSEEVARYCTVSKLTNDNHARIAELCERQVQESLAQKAKSTSAMLGSFRPLVPGKPKGPVHKAPPAAKDSTGAVIVKKAPPPKLGDNRPPAIKPPPQRQQTGPPKGQGAATQPTLGTQPAPSSPKGSSQSHLDGRIVSPRGNPPPRIIPKTAHQSRASSVTDAQTPRSTASMATADLEELLRKKKEAKRARPDEQAEVQRDDQGQPKQQRSRHHKQEHRSGRDTRRRNRSPSDHSSSSDSSDEDRRSPSSRGSRSRRHRHSRRRRSRSRRGSRSARRRRDSSEEERRSRSKKREDEHRSSKDKRRRDSSSPSKEQETEQQVEEGNQTQSSQPVQAKAMGPQQVKQPPLPPPDTVPTSASSASTVQTQGGTVSQPPAQQSQGHVAQAALTATTHYPMAKAVPLHQSQGHVQVAVQPDPRPMPTRQAQGQVQVMQPLPSPLYPPQQQLVAVQPRQQAQQLAAPPGLGTSQERNQAAHIQQMERELASLRAQLQATQPQVPSRQSSQSPDGWGWNQSQGGQWHGYGWHNWGDGRGYQ